MLDVELKDIINILGQPTKKSGHQYYFQCPVCKSRGEDSSKDNLLFHDTKKILKCFACDEGSKEVLRLINLHKERKPHNTVSIRDIKPKWYEVNKDNLLQYLFESSSELNSIATSYLHNRCIESDVIDWCGIGYDNQPNMVSIGPSITLPMFSVNHDEQLVGFELRQLGEKKIIKHTLDSPTCLCAVYGKINAKNLIITEGFIDAYSLLELLKKRKDVDEYRIATGSHGCKSILPSLLGVNLDVYENCYLILDNDKAGDEATQSILQDYPFFKDKRSLLKGCKDINEYLCNKRAGNYQ